MAGKAQAFTLDSNSIKQAESSHQARLEPTIGNGQVNRIQFEFNLFTCWLSFRFSRGANKRIRTNEAMIWTNVVVTLNDHHSHKALGAPSDWFVNLFKLQLFKTSSIHALLSSRMPHNLTLIFVRRSVCVGGPMQSKQNFET